MKNIIDNAVESLDKMVRECNKLYQPEMRRKYGLTKKSKKKNKKFRRRQMSLF